MKTLLTVEKAKQKMEELQRYINLAESYNPETIEQRVIKEYAYSSSIRVVVENLNKLGFDIEREAVTNIIKGKPIDELHRIVRTGYMKKTKEVRTRYK